MWYVYILECRNASFYTGITTNLERRFKEHLQKTARYTSYNPPRKILYQESFSSHSEAARREAEIKRWRRSKKMALIRGGGILSGQK